MRTCPKCYAPVDKDLEKEYTSIPDYTRTFANQVVLTCKCGHIFTFRNASDIFIMDKIVLRDKNKIPRR